MRLVPNPLNKQSQANSSYKRYTLHREEKLAVLGRCGLWQLRTKQTNKQITKQREGQREGNRFSCRQGQYVAELVLFIFPDKLSIVPSLPGLLPDPGNLNCRRRTSNRQWKKKKKKRKNQTNNKKLCSSCNKNIYLFRFLQMWKINFSICSKCHRCNLKILLIQQFKNRFFTPWSSSLLDQCPAFTIAIVYPHFQIEWKRWA